MIPAGKLANADQVATAVTSTVADGAAAGSRAVDIRVWSGIDVRLLPDRGLDIGAAWFRGIPLAWISPAGEQPPPRAEELVGNAWRDAWGGGLVTTCGLSNVGAASEGHGQHGTYTARAAADLQVERTTSEVTVTGTVVDAPFTLSRRVVTAVGQGLVRIDDRVVNDSEWTAAAPLLYHVNLGAPAVGRGRLPRDGCAGGRAARRGRRCRAAHLGRAAGRRPTALPSASSSTSAPRGLASRARRLGVELTLRSSLPRLWQWVDPASGTYALGIEPANCSVLGREHDIATGRMPFLDPGEARTSWLTLAARLL